MVGANENLITELLANSAVLDGPCDANGCPGKLTNPNAMYPRVDVNDASSSRQFSSFWVEDGSYVRLRTLQVDQAPIRDIYSSVGPGSDDLASCENVVVLDLAHSRSPSIPSGRDLT